MITEEARPTPLTDLVVQAALEIGEPFTAEQLTMQTFFLFPDRFCMRGFPNHPDHHKVLAMLCGRRGLPARGLLQKISDRFVVTAKGREFAVASRRGEKAAPPTRTRPNAVELELYRTGKPNIALCRFMSRSRADGRVLSGREAMEAFGMPFPGAPGQRQGDVDASDGQVVAKVEKR